MNTEIQWGIKNDLHISNLLSELKILYSNEHNSHKKIVLEVDANFINWYNSILR